MQCDPYHRFAAEAILMEQRNTREPQQEQSERGGDHLNAAEGKAPPPVRLRVLPERRAEIVCRHCRGLLPASRESAAATLPRRVAVADIRRPQ